VGYHLSESVAKGIGLVVRYPAAFTQYSRLPRELSEQRVQNDPSACAQLVSHLLSSTEPPFYGYEITVSIHLASLHPVDARLTETGHTPSWRVPDQRVPISGGLISPFVSAPGPHRMKHLCTLLDACVTRGTVPGERCAWGAHQGLCAQRLNVSMIWV
jgi:hypothetical protein